MRYRYWHKKGITLIELVAVMAIMSILAAMAAPSVYGFISVGQRNNKDSIARTIYITAQNQLSEKKANGTLAEFTKDLVDSATGKVKKDSTSPEANDGYSVAQRLGCETGATTPTDFLSTENPLNTDYIAYISKPIGELSGARGVSADIIKDLLESVLLDQSVLNNAILIEFNVNNGVVLSVFYGDSTSSLNEPKNDQDVNGFFYSTGGDTKNNKGNIYGARPFSTENPIGYYGADNTGKLRTDVQNVKVRMLDGNVEPIINVGDIYSNVMYAEFIVDASLATKTSGATEEPAQGVVLQLLGEQGDKEPLYESTPFYLSEIAADTIAADFKTINPTINTHMIYNQNGFSTLNTGLNRIVWVLDYLKFELLETDTVKNDDSIGVKYKDVVEKALAEGGSIRAAIRPATASEMNTATNQADIDKYNALPALRGEALKPVHALFEGEKAVAENTTTGTPAYTQYNISTPRHLFNTKYIKDSTDLKNLTGNFVQTANIDLASVKNLAPLTEANGYFSGTYDGGGYTISDMVIDVADKINDTTTPLYNNLGLFGTNKGTIESLKLDNVVINGATDATAEKKPASENVGAIAGINYGAIENVTVKNSTISAYKYVGGIAGQNLSEAITGTAPNPDVINVGTIQKAIIDSCNVTGSGDFVGGAVGKVSITEYKSAAPIDAVTALKETAVINTEVAGSDYVGGIVGELGDYTIQSTETSKIGKTSASDLMFTYAKSGSGDPAYTGGAQKTDYKNPITATLSTDTPKAGGLVGYMSNSSKITNSLANAYFNGNVNPGIGAYVATGETGAITPPTQAEFVVYLTGALFNVKPDADIWLASPMTVAEIKAANSLINASYDRWQKGSEEIGKYPYPMLKILLGANEEWDTTAPPTKIKDTDTPPTSWVEPITTPKIMSITSTDTIPITTYYLVAQEKGSYTVTGPSGFTTLDIPETDPEGATTKWENATVETDTLTIEATGTHFAYKITDSIVDGTYSIVYSTNYPVKPIDPNPQTPVLTYTAPTP